MKKYFLLFIFFAISMLFTNFSNAEIQIKHYYTCDSIKYPKYSFGFYLNKNNSVKVYKINKKKFLYHKIQYVDYKTFVNLKFHSNAVWTSSGSSGEPPLAVVTNCSASCLAAAACCF